VDTPEPPNIAQTRLVETHDGTDVPGILRKPVQAVPGRNRVRGRPLIPVAAIGPPEVVHAPTMPYPAERAHCGGQMPDGASAQIAPCHMNPRSTGVLQWQI